MQPLARKKKRFLCNHMSRAHDLDLEHTLDARSPGDHHVQVWSHRRNQTIFVVVEEICAKSLQTVRQTDDGRRAIVLAHGMS